MRENNPAARTDFFSARSVLKLIFACVSAITVAGILAGGLAKSASARGRRIQIADLQKVVRVADPQISPDDKSIVVTVSRANMKDDRFDDAQGRRWNRHHARN